MSRTATSVRTASALLCAALFAPVATGQPAEADSGHGPPGRAEARVEKLYREAAKATRAFEKARKESDAQHKKVRRLRGRVAEAREQLGELRSGTGRMARSQYRNGGLSQASKLLLSDSPEHFLRASALLRQGDQAAARMLVQLHRAEKQLAADERKASAALGSLRSKAKRQNRIRDHIQTRLARAEQRLNRVRAQEQAGPMRLLSTTAAAPASPVSGKRNTGGAWVVPVKGYTLSAGFASSGGRWANGHTGQDFAVPDGTPVRATGSGSVVEAGDGGSFGNNVVIKHSNGYYTQYAHLSSVGVGRGKRVEAGERIGLSGSTGNSTGPHLHFEVRVTPQYGSGVDPVPWLREHGVHL